jgi:hypothetical protein
MDFVRKEAVSSTTREIVSDIQQVRINALTLGNPAMPNLRGYGFRLASLNSFVIFAFNDVNPTDYTYSGSGEEANPLTRTLRSTISVRIPSAYDPSYTVLIYDRLGVPARYHPDGSPPAPYAPLANQPLLVLTVGDPTVNFTQCISVRLNSVREGAWNSATSSCVEQ